MLSIVVAISVLSVLISSECSWSAMRLLLQLLLGIGARTPERRADAPLGQNFVGLDREFLSVCRVGRTRGRVERGSDGTHSARVARADRSGRRRSAPPTWRWKRWDWRSRRPPGRRISASRRERRRALGGDPRRRYRRSGFRLRASAAGYRVTVLEARDRIGGRSWTIRGGDRDRPDRPARSARDLRSRPLFQLRARRASRSPTVRSSATPAASACSSRTFINVNRNAGWDFGGKVFPERRMV